MSSEAITEKPEQGAVPDGNWRPHRETAPSVLRADEPTFARWLGLVGLATILMGTLILLAAGRQLAHGVAPTTFGTMFVTLGLACLLFHAARETDNFLRRLYWLLGLFCIVIGVLVSALPIRGAAGTQFLPYGFTAMTLGLLFLLPTVRNETEESYRRFSLLLLGLFGAILSATGFVGGNLSENFLLPYGLLLTLLGLMYLWAFVGLQGADSDVGYRAAWGMGIGGAAFLLLALGRSFVPWLLYLTKLKTNLPESYFVPSGLLLGAEALLFVALAFSLASDNRFVVLTRRELAAFFYSPIAYFVFFGMTIVALWVFYSFVNILFAMPMMGEPSVQEPEPILIGYVIGWFPMIATLFVIPVLTMRLLSEENRTGTLEVLFTAPVTETSVVLSKFTATFIVYLLSWVPTGLYLIALRVEGGQAFEYRPLLSFFLALACSGAAFVSMGLFCSSLTRNQIIGAVLSFVGMLLFFSLFFLKQILEPRQSSNPLQATSSVWASVFDYISFVSLWITSMRGELAPRQLVLQLSIAAFFLFLTVKVLESRKWR